MSAILNNNKVLVKDAIEQERVEVAKELARELGYTNTKNVFSEPVAFNSERVKPKIGKRLRKPLKPFFSQKPKVTKKKKNGKRKV